MTCSITHLHKRQNGKCYFCGRQTYLKQDNQSRMKSKTASREHLIPKAHGGSNRIVNIKLACHQCNKDRGTIDAVLWMRIVRNPKKLEAFYRARSLQKKLTKIKVVRRREARVLRKHGLFHKIIYVDSHTFQRLFTVQCAA
jgi:hypothetical protein